MTEYSISLEGHLGFDNLEDAVDLYTKLNEVYLKWLKEQSIERKEKLEPPLYQTYAIKIYKENIFFLVYVDTYYSHDLYDLSDWLEGVIKQIESQIPAISEKARHSA